MKKGQKLYFTGKSGHVRCPDPRTLCRMKSVLHSEAPKELITSPVKIIATIAIILALGLAGVRVYVDKKEGKDWDFVMLKVPDETSIVLLK